MRDKFCSDRRPGRKVLDMDPFTTALAASAMDRPVTGARSTAMASAPSKAPSPMMKVELLSSTRTLSTPGVRTAMRDATTSSSVVLVPSAALLRQYTS